MFKILHIASFNGNVGDNANHNGFRKWLKTVINDEIDYQDIEIRDFYQSWQLRNFNSDDFIQSCNDHDLVIIGGGNFFELKWDYSKTGTTIDISKDTLDQIKTPILFNAVGCDIGKGTTPENVSKFKDFFDYITSSNRIMTTLRNDGSLETIQGLFEDRYTGKVFKVPDGGFFVESEKYHFPEVIKGYKAIGVNLATDMKDIRFNVADEFGCSYEQFIEEYSAVINDFLSNHSDYQVIFFPHIYSDMLPIYEVISKLNDSFRRLRVTVAPCITGTNSEKYLFGLYRKCDLIMGMRFHSNVCAIAQNIPIVALSSYRKIGDLLSDLGLHDRMVSINKLGFRTRLEDLIEETLNNRVMIENRLKRTNNFLHVEEELYMMNIKKWLSQQK